MRCRVQYPTGILTEHLHTRAQAGLFDVSHMGQLQLSGADPAIDLEKLVPGDLRGLGQMRMRYTLLLNGSGGILDDLMVTRFGDRLFVVVNAATKDIDFDHLHAHLSPAVRIERLDDRALLALQGPMAAAVMTRFAEGIAEMPFMSAMETTLDGQPCLVTRSGYTGEDGFEISLAAEATAALAERLLAEPEVAPSRARRTRLAAPRSRAVPVRPRYRRDDNAGRSRPRLDDRQEQARRPAISPAPQLFSRQLAQGPARKRVGIRPDGRAPAREGTAIADPDGSDIGRVTSGGFGPSVGAPVAMGYVDAAHATAGTALSLTVRGSARPARIVRLPFVPHRYHRG